MKRALAGLALVMLVASTALAVRTANYRSQQSTETDGDSLSATADTGVVTTIPSAATDFYVTIWCDSVAAYRTQVSPDGGTTWLTVDLDTTAAATLESGPDLTPYYNGWSVRTIIDGLWSTGKKVGESYYYHTDK